MRTVYSVVLGLALVLGAPVTATQAPGLGRSIDELITRYVPYGFSGAVIIAKNGDVVLQKAYGEAHVAKGTANRLDTFFDIGSLTKTFTAAAVLRLETQGKLSTSDSISKYLDGVPADKSAITIAQVLSHTSGLPRDSAQIGIADSATRDEVIRQSLAAPLTSVPGQTYSYSNVGFTLLAAVIERVSGSTWQDYLREQLFKPAGLSEATFMSPSMASDARVAVGYSGPTGSVLQASAPDVPAWGRGLGATGVLTPVGDLYKWWLALHKDGVLSTPARTRVFTAPTVGDEPFGWHIEKRSDGSTRIHKGGVVQAFEAQVAHYPESGVVMIFAMNKNINMRAPVWDAIERVILAKEYTLPPVISDVRVPLGDFIGDYQLPTGGKISAWVDSDRLSLGAIGQDAVNLLAYPDNTNPALHLDTNAMTEKLVQALRKGDVASSPEVPDPANVKRYWQNAVTQNGAVRAHQVLGTNPRAPGIVQTYVRVEFENSTQVIRFSWSGGKLGPLGNGIPMPGLTTFNPQSPSAFASFDYRTSQSVRIDFEKDAAGKISSLRFLSKDGRAVATAKKIS